MLFAGAIENIDLPPRKVFVGAKDIAAGQGFGLLLKADGSLWAWAIMVMIKSVMGRYCPAVSQAPIGGNEEWEFSGTVKSYLLEITEKLAGI